MMPSLFISVIALASELAEATMHPDVITLAGVRVRELAVPVVRERHVASAHPLEALDVREVSTDRIRVLNPNHRDLLSCGDDAPHVVRRQREFDPVRRDLLSEPMYRLELGQSLLMRVGVALWGQLSLAHIDDHPRHVEGAFLHVGKVHLRGKLHRVVALGGEVRGADVVVRIERDDPLVDAACALDQIGFGLCAGVAPAAGSGHQERNEGDQL